MILQRVKEHLRQPFRLENDTSHLTIFAPARHEMQNTHCKVAEIFQTR